MISSTPSLSIIPSNSKSGSRYLFRFLKSILGLFLFLSLFWFPGWGCLCSFFSGYLCSLFSGCLWIGASCILSVLIFSTGSCMISGVMKGAASVSCTVGMTCSLSYTGSSISGSSSSNLGISCLGFLFSKKGFCSENSGLGLPFGFEMRALFCLI